MNAPAQSRKRARRRLPQVVSDPDFDRLARMPSKTAPTGIRNAAILAVMRGAGLRVSEVCNLSPNDLVRTGTAAQTLRVRQGKGGVDRSNLALAQGDWALLERWAAIRPSSRYFFSTLSGNRLSERYMHAMVGRYSARAGVTRPDGQPLHPHMLRHTYATRLIERGIPIHDVAKLLGHSSIATTERYLHVNDSTLADRVRVALEAEPGSDATMRRLIREELQTLTGGS